MTKKPPTSSVHLPVASRDILETKNTLHGLASVIRAVIIAIPSTLAYGPAGLTALIEPLLRIPIGSNAVHHGIGDARINNLKGVHWGRSLAFLIMLGGLTVVSAGLFKSAINKYLDEISGRDKIQSMSLEVDNYEKGKQESLDRLDAFQSQVRKTLADEASSAGGSGASGKSAMYLTLQIILENGDGFPPNWNAMTPDQQTTFVVQKLNAKNSKNIVYNLQIANSFVQQLRGHPQMATYVTSSAGTGLRDHLKSMVMTDFIRLDGYANQVRDIIKQVNPSDPKSVAEAIKNAEPLLKQLRREYNTMNDTVGGVVDDTNTAIGGMTGVANSFLQSHGVKTNPHATGLNIEPAELESGAVPELGVTPGSTSFWTPQRLKALGGPVYFILLLQGLIEIFGLMFTAYEARRREISASRPLTDPARFRLTDSVSTPHNLHNDEDGGILDHEETPGTGRNNYANKLHARVRQAEDPNRTAAMVAAQRLDHSYGRLILPTAFNRATAYSEMFRRAIASVPPEEAEEDQ